MNVRYGVSDAFIYGKKYMKFALETEYHDLKILEEDERNLGVAEIAVGININRPELKETIDNFIDKLNTEKIGDETILQNMENRWISKGIEEIPEDVKEPENAEITLRVGTSGLVKPMTYYKGNDVNPTGFDIEFCKRLAMELNVKLQFCKADFTALSVGLTNNTDNDKTYDIVVSSLNITKEREENFYFSKPYFYSETAVVVKKTPEEMSYYTSVDQLKDKRLGFLEGSAYIDKVKELYPDCIQSEYKSFADLISAVKNCRIDSYFIDEPIALTQVKDVKGIKILKPIITEENYAFMFNKKDENLCKAINECIAEFKKDGVLEQLKRKWIESTEKPTMKAKNDWEITQSRKLKIGLAPDSPPFAYLYNGEYAGYDVELLYMIAEKLGYEVEVNVVDFGALVLSVESEKNDIVIGCITVTEKREKTVLFSNATYNSASVAVVLEEETNGGFFDNLSKSFERTFIREQRWKMIANGLLTTLELAVFTLVIGTLLGFGFSFLLRSKNTFVSKLASGISIILNGLPILIILMVFYYIIFAKTSLSAITIGIIGLSIDFANIVAGIINTGIIAVDKGQIEVATSMGYPKWKIFFRIVLPQVVNQMFSQYTGAIIAMIKGTSIIGYITVIDLTKASDIIRSTTYEAFFPLIATAIIYFIIARIFVSLLKMLAKRFNPKHRKRMIKGVKIDD